MPPVIPTMTQITATTTTYSPFLDLLPPELRLQIYTYLLVSPHSLSGPHARATNPTTPLTEIHTPILRVNRQIHMEARTIFFGANTFRISSVPMGSEENNGEVGRGEAEIKGICHAAGGTFEPPLLPKDLPLLRHLDVDMLYYPRDGQRCSDAGCPATQRYVSSVTHLLGFVKGTLLGLRFVADARGYCSDSDDDDDEEGGSGEDLDVKRLLAAFRIAEVGGRFNRVVGQMARINKVPTAFVFPECYFAATFGRDELARKTLFRWACQVVLARSEMKVKAILEALGDDDEDDVEREEEGELVEGGFEARDWPSKESVQAVALVAKALEMTK